MNGNFWSMITIASLETIYITFLSSLLGYILGLPIGILLSITKKDSIMPNIYLNNILSSAVIFLRSIPFIILLVILIPVTRIVTGKGTGTAESIIFPLFISAFPFVAKLVESSIDEVDKGVIEASISMGSSIWQIIYKVLLIEALPSLLNGVVISITTILGYTAMASTVGGGGLGALAVIKGVSQRKYDIMYMASFVLIALVQIINILGSNLVKLIDHRNK